MNYIQSQYGVATAPERKKFSPEPAISRSFRLFNPCHPIIISTTEQERTPLNYDNLVNTLRSSLEAFPR
jgi:hypothetical protein